MIRNPGLRTDEQKQRGKRRIAHMLAERGKRDGAGAAAADLPSPADVDHQWASTYSIVRRGRLTTSPRPGDLGMYGSRWAPHHVEIYCGAPGQEFIGHGSPPIDSLTPERPDFYLTNGQPCRLH